jgi:hypothetical protein
MAALFSSFATKTLRLALLLSALGVVSVPSLLMAWVRTPWFLGQRHPVDQPVLFDHRHHAGDDGIDCRYCHSTAETSRYASVPSTDVCIGCHAQIWTGSPLLEPVLESFRNGEPIRWNRVHRLPSFVYFDHSIHARKGVGCVTCHGRVDRMAQVQQEAPLTMSWCLDCHRAPESRLRPRSQIASMDWQPAGDPARLAAELAREYQPRRLTHCSACHR